MAKSTTKLNPQDRVILFCTATGIDIARAPTRRWKRRRDLPPGPTRTQFHNGPRPRCPVAKCPRYPVTEARRFDLLQSGRGIRMQFDQPKRRDFIADAARASLAVDGLADNGAQRLQLSSVAKQAKAALGAEKLDAIADRGYFNGEEILACEKADITTTLPIPLVMLRRRRMVTSFHAGYSGSHSPSVSSIDSFPAVSSWRITATVNDFEMLPIW